MAATFEEGIVPFRQFVESLNAGRAEHYLNVPHGRIADEQAFSEIQSYLTNYYSGVESVHSFVDTNGSIFDCIPVEKQVSLRDKTGPLPQPPDLPTDPARARVGSASYARHYRSFRKSNVGAGRHDPGASQDTSKSGPVPKPPRIL